MIMWMFACDHWDLETAYVHSTIFKHANALLFSITLPGKETSKVSPGIQSPKIFQEVGKYLLTLAIKEINEGVDPVLTACKGKVKAFMQTYQAQFTAFAQGAYPFNMLLGVDQDLLNWWEAYQVTPNGGILVVCKVSITSGSSETLDYRQLQPYALFCSAAFDGWWTYNVHCHYDKHMLRFWAQPSVACSCLQWQ